MVGSPKPRPTTVSYTHLDVYKRQAMYQGVSRTERISVMDSGDYTDDSSVKHHLQIDENDINSYIQMLSLIHI